MMHRPAVADLLRVPAAAYPTFTLDDDVIDLWTAALQSYDASIARMIVGRWVQAEDRPPTVHAIVEACRRETRERSADRRAAAEPPDPDAVRGTLALWRETLAAALSGSPLDPEVVVEMAHDRGLVAPSPLRRCSCDLDGFVSLTDGTVEPCSRCNHDGYERWQAGAWDLVVGVRR